MNAADLMRQKQILTELARRLGKNVSQLERETSELQKQEGDYGQGSHTGDYQEITNQSMEEYVAQHLLGNQEFTLSETEAALERIKLGTYGICSECKGKIALERLQALPYARRCIQCAQSLHG